MIHAKLIICSSLVFSAFAQEEKPNFTGTWVHEGRGPGREVDWIDHKEPVFIITPKVGLADVVFTSTYTTDGSESTRKYTDGQVTRSAHWEGKTLVLETKFKKYDLETVKSEAFSLSADGSVITKDIHITGPGKKPDERVIFTKAPAKDGQPKTD